MKISFTDFIILPNKIECNCTITKNDTCIFDHIIFFKFSSSITISENIIAIALSTLCINGKYSIVYFDLNIASNIVAAMQNYCKCTILAKTITNPYKRKINSDTILLNFSGGFDSLAAYHLMPTNTKLISLDFGTRFTYESSYFSTFSPYTVTTNIRDLRLTDASWSFMGIASILYSESLYAKYISFGTIFEASPYHLYHIDSAAKLSTFAPFSCAQLINAPFVISITEIGTALIMVSLCPECIEKSLQASSTPGSRKFYRKQLLITNAIKKSGKPYACPCLIPPSGGPFLFGEAYADDFLCPYLLKQFGKTLVSPLQKNIPDEIIACANGLSLTFYERYHPDFIASLPTPLKDLLISRLNAAHILPYTDADYKELEQVKNLLLHYHLN